MTLIDFLNILELDQPVEPDFHTPIVELAKKVHVFSDWNLINDSKLQRVNRFIAEQEKMAKDNFYRDYRMKRIMATQSILDRRLRYRHPRLINFEQIVRGGFDQMWVLPIFL